MLSSITSRIKPREVSPRVRHGEALMEAQLGLRTSLRRSVHGSVATPVPAAPTRRYFRLRATLTLLVCDSLALAFGALLAIVAGWVSGVSLPVAVTAIACYFGVALVASTAYGRYSIDAARADHATTDDLAHVFHLTILATVASSLVVYVGQKWLPVQPALVMFATTIVSMPVLRAVARKFRIRYAGFEQRTLVVGAGSVGQLLGAKLINRPIHGFELVGFVDDVPANISEPALLDVPLLGQISEIPAIVDRYEIDRVIVAFTQTSHERTVKLVRSLKDLAVHVDVVPRLFDVVGPEADIHTIDGLPLVGHPRRNTLWAANAVKRALDLACSLTAIVLLAPLLLLIAVAVRLSSSGPILYAGERIGQDGVRFQQLKFRTMYAEMCDGPGYGGHQARENFEHFLSESGLKSAYEKSHKLDHDPRVTSVGRLLRRTSLDELPQLMNIVRGDLAIVGPRPVTEEELPRYGDDVSTLLSVRPGLTGLWQVTGRSALNYDERVRLDVGYAKDWSLKLDAKILLRSPSLFTSRTKAV